MNGKIFSGYGIKKPQDWKRCADLAITWNSGASIRQRIFYNAIDDDHFRVSAQMNGRYRGAVSYRSIVIILCTLVT